MEEYTSEEIDQKLALLAQSKRRAIIHFLQHNEEDQVSVCKILSYLQESDTTQNEESQVAIALHHNHLPNMAATDVLDFDSSSRTVRYNGDELVEALLESIPERHNTDG